MSLDSQITSLLQAIAVDTKTIGAVSALQTTVKTTLVAALNELKAAVDAVVGGGGAGIDDSGTSTDVTWSSAKIQATVNSAISALVNDAPEALDTLKELADYLDDNPTLGTSLVTAIGNRVRYDAAQDLTSGQQLQACQNIGVGDPTTDFAAAYAAAKAS